MKSIKVGTQHAVSKKEEKMARESRVVSEKKEYGGLCSTCKNASSCMYLKEQERPVLQCEEFECE